jgi:hypothetical protein
VDEQRQIARLDHEHLPGAADARDLPARERVERGVEGLHRHHAGSERGLDLGALERPVEAPRGDLDLGQLGHNFRLGDELLLRRA